MGFFDTILSQFIDFIEWTDDSDNTMVYRFQRDGNEIKNGAKLTVRESQIAVFVNEGEIADIFEPGIYELTTRNLPLLTTLKHWDHGFNSPFKAEVYFFNLRNFTNLKWGTKNAIILKDKEFNGIRIRSYGSYNIQIENPIKFLTEIVGTDGYFSVDEISNQLRNIIVSHFATLLGELNIPLLDFAQNYETIGELLEEKISPDFSAYGLKLHTLLVENISPSQEVEKAFDEKTSMRIIGNLDDYLAYQSAKSLSTNSSVSTSSIGIGMGLAMAQNITTQQSEPKIEPKSAPIPKAQTYYLAIDNISKGPYTIEQIKSMIKERTISKNTLAWREGMSSWENIVNLKELNRLFSLIPPPLPSEVKE